jgi:hypothetical protein
MCVWWRKFELLDILVNAFQILYWFEKLESVPRHISYELSPESLFLVLDMSYLRTSAVFNISYIKYFSIFHVEMVMTGYERKCNSIICICNTLLFDLFNFYYSYNVHIALLEIK